MNLAQSSHIPAPGHRPTLKDMPWLASYCVRGLWELVLARIVFARLEARDIPQRNRESKSAAAQQASVRPAVTPAITPADLARMSYVLPRLSDRLPWRSDCLVQAIAAQHWLSTFGAASEIQIGVEHPEGGDFGAHAWLLYNDKVVTGGDIDRYHLILSESRIDRDSDD